jgi:hypothetical protein
MNLGLKFNIAVAIVLELYRTWRQSGRHRAGARTSADRRATS